MCFNDDELCFSFQDFSEEKSAPSIKGNIEMTVFNIVEAPLEECKFKVMLELMGKGYDYASPGVDLVMVLDISKNMEGEKLATMKIAVQFVIKKLRSGDRLSIVTFATDSKRLCPLRQITENSQAEIENLVIALDADGGSNITAGLQTGLKVLDDRTFSTGRAVGIILLSKCQPEADDDAAYVWVGDVPVYTFGLGTDYDPRVLLAVAENSRGGTFSDCQNPGDLSIAFSQCLASLFTVRVQDVKLTITHINSKIHKVSTGTYPQSMDHTGSVTVSFGDLYSKELRKVLVDLVLPVFGSEGITDILQINCTYISGGKFLISNPQIITINRIHTYLEL